MKKFYVVCPDCATIREKKDLKTLAVWKAQGEHYYYVKCYHPNQKCYFQKYQAVFTAFWDTAIEDSVEDEEETFIIPIPDTVVFKLFSDYENLSIYSYKNTDGEVLFYKVRTSDKRFFYVSLTTNGWVNRKPPIKCLFGAQYLDSFKNVVLVEGEKTAKAAMLQLKNTAWCAVCGPSGASNIDIDFELLKDKNVVCWPDNDEVGKTFAKTLYEKYGIPVVDIHSLNLPKKWDLADNLSVQVLTTQQIIDLLQKCKAGEFYEA